MAIKDTNHRLSVTLTESEYAEVRALGEDLGGKSASKAAAHAVRGYFEVSSEVEDLRVALDMMAGEAVSRCWWGHDWSYVHMLLTLPCAGNAAQGLTRSAVVRYLSDDGATMMAGEYRRAYVEWCGREGKETGL